MALSTIDMKLSAKTRYGVRAVFDIAFHTQDRPGLAVPAKDIAEREGVPLRYLEQIFQDLRRAGLVESKRGPRGGYFLKLPSSEVTLADLVSALEGKVEGFFCTKDEFETRKPASAAITSSLWEELGDVIGQWFRGVTVEDLVTRANEIGMDRGANHNMYFI